MSALAVACLALAVQAAPKDAAPKDNATELVQTLEPAFDVADYQLIDLDGDGRPELVVVGSNGELRTYDADRASPGKLASTPVGSAVLADPAHTLLDLASLLGDAKQSQLVALAPDGVTLYVADEQGELRLLANLTRRARFTLRVGEPMWADFVTDVNADGSPDIVAPSSSRLEVWINQGLAQDPKTSRALPSFKKTAAVATEITRWGSRTSRNLSDVLESSFAIPKLAVRDVNGDHRPDLYVSEGSTRSWHLQRADGSFPETPDVTVDLSLFRDTTEVAKIRPGHTLAVRDEPTIETRDLDGDGIPDYAIAHRRKVWVFLSTKNGPQFTTPSTIVKTADDITALSLVHLDDDNLPDLLLIKVQVPTIAELIRGVFGDWDVDIDATGYKNVDGKSFESTPRWKHELVVRLPAILKLFKNPEQFIQRFEEAAKRFRGGTIGDFNGDQKPDVLLVSEDKSKAELWRGRTSEPDAGEKTTLDRQLRRVLFEDTDATWDLDRIAMAFAGFAERRAAALTGGRPADSSFALRDRANFELTALRNADFEPDRKDEVIAVYRRRENSKRMVFDIFRVR